MPESLHLISVLLLQNNLQEFTTHTHKLKLALKAGLQDFWIRQYPYKSQLFHILGHNSQTIIPTHNSHS